MKMRVLGAFGGEGIGQRSSAFLLNDRVLIDGGNVGGSLSVPEQLDIEHALVSHAHLDHVAGLASLAETLACSGSGRAVKISGIAPVLATIQGSVFNNVVWPNFASIPAGAPAVQYRTLVEDAEQRVGELWVTPVAVSHTVPASGFIIHDGGTGLVYSGDTAPTEALWQAARSLGGIRAVLLECAFPDRLAGLAEVSRHLTPSLVRREVDKISADVPVWIFHVKPQFHGETIAEIHELLGSRVSLIEQDKTYTF
jgi:ribonuclease BN (tRNA processing enzyme)